MPRGARRTFCVTEGAVYVLDGSRTSSSNLAEEGQDQPLSVFNVKLHMLSRGDVFDLRRRRPRKLSRQTRQAKQLETSASD